MAIDRHVAMVLFGTRTPTPAQVRKGQEVRIRLPRDLAGTSGKRRPHGGAAGGERGKIVETYEQYLEEYKKNSTTYLPKTEKEKAEAYKLLDDFLNALARRQAFRELVAAKLVSDRPPEKGA